MVRNGRGGIGGGLPEGTPGQAGTPPWQKQPTGPSAIAERGGANPAPACHTVGKARFGRQWVHTVDYGWIWVPSEARAADVDGVPYTYLYTPHFGWTWSISPWGPWCVFLRALGYSSVATRGMEPSTLGGASTRRGGPFAKTDWLFVLWCDGGLFGLLLIRLMIRFEALAFFANDGKPLFR
jgi:hypothetical protein